MREGAVPSLPSISRTKIIRLSHGLRVHTVMVQPIRNAIARHDRIGVNAMNAQPKPSRDHVARPRSTPSVRATSAVADPKTLAPHAHDQLPGADDGKHVDPLWMITVAGAVVFVFLALAAAFD